MSDHRIYVYAICKNEAAFARRWYDSMSEADGVYVLDTGSDDGTPDILRALGAHVTQRTVSPWRFDTARNLALDLVPEDAELCVSTDLDEAFRPGWRAHMENALDAGAQRLRYRFTWNYMPDGRDGLVYWMDKAHPRHGFRWVYPVHEVLYTEGQYVTVTVPEIQLEHHPDPEKSRRQYLALLEQAVRDAPDDDRCMHYLGREYMYYRRWSECESVLKRHLALPSARWNEERCASMRYIAKAVRAQGREDEAMCWLLRAAAEAPHMREPWLDAAQLALDRKEWSGALYFACKALEITERSRTYINESDSWGAKPCDIAALAAYYLGLYTQAHEYGRLALAIEPQDERLRRNLEFYEQALSSAV